MKHIESANVNDDRIQHKKRREKSLRGSIDVTVSFVFDEMEI